MAELKDISPGSDSRQNWRTINQMVQRLRQLESQVRLLADQVTALRLRRTKQGADGGDGLVFRGEYDPGAGYSKDDIVVRRGGIAAGLYIATKSIASGVPPTYPETGDGWVLLAPGNTRGAWT